jgi:cell division protein FtsZ
MQDIVQDALDNANAERKKAREVQDTEFGDPNISIIGVGGAGNNTINRLMNVGVSDAHTIAVNTDKQHLQMIEADTKILVGKSLTEGLGAVGDPEMGARAVEMAKGTIQEVINDSDIVFLTAGMGGGTGTGGAPVIASIAKEIGALVVGMVSSPFNVERARMVKAEDGLQKFCGESDSIIVLDNNRLLDYVPNLPVGKAFSVMDQIIAETVKGISETITQPSLINLDYADVKTILGQSGVAVMLVGETQQKDRPERVVQDAMNHPLLDVDYRGASGGLVHITGGSDLTLKEAEAVANKITERLDPGANVIWGARIQNEFKGKLRVMAIMTDIDSSGVLGATAQKQADRSRSAMNSSEVSGPSETMQPSEEIVSDGGEDEDDTNFGIDVIR